MFQKWDGLWYLSRPQLYFRRFVKVYYDLYSVLPYDSFLLCIIVISSLFP
jgi:hypothetical protein